MKILQVISSIDISIGGPARSLPTMCCELQKKDVNNKILTYISGSPNDTDLKKSGVDISFVKKESTYLGKLLSLNYKEALKKEKSDIVHIHSLWNISLHWAIRYANKYKIPLLVSPRGTLEPKAFAMKSNKKKLALTLYQKKDLESVKCIHATALEEAKNIRILGFKNPIAIIPNGINIGNYPLKNFKLKRKGKTVLFLSRIHPKKGIELLLETWANIDDSIRKEWNLLLVGDGDERYISIIKNLILNKYSGLRISYAGPKYGKDKLEIYHSSDLFILPTMSENFGMVVAEAMSCGLPVITTKGAPWGILEEYNAGWWVDFDFDQLKASLIESISLSDAEREKKGKICREIIENYYSIESVSKSYVELYQWLSSDSINPPSFVLMK